MSIRQECVVDSAIVLSCSGLEYMEDETDLVCMYGTTFAMVFRFGGKSILNFSEL